MNEKRITFGVWEVVVVIVNAIGARIYLNYPRVVIESAGTAAWIEAIYISSLVLIFFTIISRLYSNFAGKDLIDLGSYIGGTFGRVLVGIPNIFILLFIGPVILREYSESMKIIALPVSPISFVMLFFVVGMIIGAYLGIEAIVRLHAIIVPITILAYLLILAGVNKYYDTSQIYPILGNGAGKIFGDGFFKISIFAPILYIFMFPPFIKSHKNFKKAGYTALAICSSLLFLGALVFVLVFPYPTSLERFLPTYELARLIEFGRFFQRIESIFMLAWATSGFMYLSVILYFCTYTFKKMFKLEYQTPLILPFAIIMYSLSILPPNLMSAIMLETKYYIYFAWIIALVIPMIILIISNLKRKHQKGGKSK